LHAVVHDTYAYSTNSLGAAAMKAPKTGGGVPSLVTAADQPSEIAQDDQTMHFILERIESGRRAVPKVGRSRPGSRDGWCYQVETMLDFVPVDSLGQHRARVLTSTCKVDHVTAVTTLRRTPGQIRTLNMREVVT